MSVPHPSHAVFVRNATKYYGTKLILNELCMNVNRGTIYGLLGASGCGKTTLLSCIVGVKKLNSGDIFVLGGKPGTEGSGVPGPRIGYMPQDIALIPEFTVKGAVYYFGRIFDMPRSLIEERFAKLSKLLDLPPEDRMLKNCSGGQQRRVSFAAAMVHSPELLILDEPTVGLDPVLRDSIWNYLVEVTEKENIAVIITTHYIEEARQAHRIGLMREGKLLAEETPNQLMNLFRTDTLEEVFLILSRRQAEGRLEDLEHGVTDDQNNSVVQVVEASLPEVSSSQGNISMVMSEVDNNGSTDVLTKKDKVKRIAVGGYSMNTRRLKALLWKNYTQIARNLSGLSFTLLFPILEILAFLLAVGDDPKDLKLGIVNDENMMGICGNYNRSSSAIPYGSSECNLDNLSCRFIEDLDDPMIDRIYYTNVDDALEEIRHGEITGVMYFSDNYTDSLQILYEEGRKIDNASLDNTRVQVWLDMSNRQIGMTLKFKLLKLYIDFTKDVFKDCNYPPKVAGLPVRFEDPVFGKEDETYTNFMVPGILLTVIFFMGTTMTSTIIISDRLEGVWDRSLVAGVSSLEIVLTHFITQFCLVIIQTFEVMLLTFLAWNIDFNGNLVTIFLIIALQGLAGMSYGFWVSVVSSTHNMANIVATGSFYPMILICGVVWPVEGMPSALQIISFCLPFTVPIVSLRNVIVKGWALFDAQVISAIYIPVLWIILLAVVNLILMRRKT